MGRLRHIPSLGMTRERNAREEEFRRVFDDCYPKVVNYARRRVADHEVDDVVSATFLVVWRRFEHIPADNPLPWVYGVARRVVSDRRRSRGRWERLRLRLAKSRFDDVPAPDPFPDEGVARALDQLRVSDSDILVLAYWEDLGPSEIAQVLEISVNAATIRLHRARTRFAAILESNSGSAMSNGESQ